jgi:hypothetical protein
MSDKPVIVAGLAVFLALATFPVWYTFGSSLLFATDIAPPDLAAPAGALEFSFAGSVSDVDLDRLRQEFAAHQMPALSSEAVLSRDELTGVWRVVDGEMRYVVRPDRDRGGTLSVYDGCVEDWAYMRANHMVLLIDWREGVVREGDTSTVEINGHPYEKSLTKTCLQCHTDREAFCYRCHQYANALPAWPARRNMNGEVGIRCWNCHIQPEAEGNDG